MKLNKRLLQLIAALWILVFHLWMPVSGTAAEQFLIRIGYVGVDVFFFTAAYSLADKKIDYVPFLKNRFLQIYLKFAIFTLIAAIYGGWSLERFLKVLLCIELFQRGGGSFLWFLPAIMIFYSLYPLLLKSKNKYTPAAVLAVWFLLSILSEKLLGYTRLFIFTNRIPVILCGYLLKKYRVPEKLLPLCLPAGLALLWFWGNTRKLNLPIREFYYILAILPVVGLGWLSGFVKSSRAVTVLGSATLETYAIQMIFGGALVTSVFKATGSKLLTNLLVIALVWSVSLALSWGFEKLFRLTAGKQKA